MQWTIVLTLSAGLLLNTLAGVNASRNASSPHLHSGHHNHTSTNSAGRVLSDPTDSEGGADTDENLASLAATDADSEIDGSIVPPDINNVQFDDNAPFSADPVNRPDGPVSALADDSVSQLNSEDSTWQAVSYAQFQNTDVRNFCGTILDPERMKALPQIVHEQLDDASSAATIPTSFDARAEWPSCKTIGTIRNQGSCGSCWAVSTSEVESDRQCIMLKRTNVFVASNDLISCCGTSCAPNNGDGCQGGYPDAALAYIASKGLPTETCEPYVAKSGQCSSTCTSNGSQKKPLYFGQTSYRVAQDVTQIQQEVMKNGPIVVAFTVYQDFMQYSSGVYQHKTGTEVGGHAVKLIGWGVDNNVPYWLIVNSWGPDWGEKGLFRMIRGKNECGIEQYLTAALAKA